MTAKVVRVALLTAAATMLLVLAVTGLGRSIARNPQLTYLSLPDYGSRGSGTRIMLADVAHGVRVPLFHTRQVPQQLTWSPDGGTLAFYPSPNPEDIHLFNPTTMTTHTLALPDLLPSPSRALLWSPDGTRLAFVARAVQSSDLYGRYDHTYVVNVVTGDIERATDGCTDISGLAWSPVNPTQVAFACRYEDAVFVSEWGTGVTTRRLSIGTSLTWTADGTGVVAYTPSGFISVANLTGDVKVLAQQSIGRDRKIAWAPDGTGLIYGASPRQSEDLFHLDLQSGTVNALADSRTYEGQPAWSHDGQWVAYVATLRGHDNVMLYNMQNNGRFRLAGRGSRDWNPTWRPAG